MKKSVLGSTVLIGMVFGAYCFSLLSVDGQSNELSNPESREEAIHLVELLDSRHEFSRALDITKSARDLPGTDRELVRLLRSEARFHWKVYEDFDAARRSLDLAETLDSEVTESALERVRLEIAARDFEAAAIAAQRAQEVASTQGERYDAGVAVAKVSVESAVHGCLKGDPYEREAVHSARDALHRLIGDAGAEPKVMRILLQASLLIQDGDSALDAVHGIYFLPDDAEPPAVIGNAIYGLRKQLPIWDESTPLESWTQLVLGLTKSRLFEEATILVMSSPSEIRTGLEDLPEVRETMAYHRFCESVRETTLSHYRRAASAGSKVSADWRDIHTALQALWPQLVGSVGSLPTRSTSSSFTKAIEKVLGPRFGTVVRYVNIDGYDGIQMGHAVSDETRTVSQYGKRASVRFVVLDSMVSNGFASWAWNSGAQHGGWTESDRIVQVRPPYASKPFRVWRHLMWPDQRAQRLQEVDEETKSDLQRANDNPRGYLPGLATRLHDQGARQLLQTLRDEGTKGPELQVAFMAAYPEAVQESSIFAHEGRHLIDRIGRVLPVPSWRKEINAKLSEVAFAPVPRLAFGAIFASNIGDNGAHGRANANIVSGLVDWMEKHQNEISEFESQLPTLPQFDKLTDDQIRAVIVSMDPMAD